MNYISIYGFKTEADLDNDNSHHIDTISQDGDWLNDAKNIINSNKYNYFYVVAESEDGSNLPELEDYHYKLLEKV